MMNTPGLTGFQRIRFARPAAIEGVPRTGEEIVARQQVSQHRAGSLLAPWVSLVKQRDRPDVFRRGSKERYISSGTKSRSSVPSAARDLNVACALWPSRAAASIAPMEAVRSE